VDFTPSVYEHAAKLIGRSPWEVSRSGELLYRAHAEAYRVYHHVPVVVGIDIYNLEAEAYGATVEDPRGVGLPAISRHILSSAREMKSLAPFDPVRDGRLGMVIDAGKRLAREFPDADVRIPVSGPFSIASNLLGFETLLCELATDPDAVAEAFAFLVEGQATFCDEIVRAGLGIAFFESAATSPLVSPRQFTEAELPALKAIIERASEAAGRSVPCIIGGDTAPILDAILATGTGYVVCPSETDQRAFMEKMGAHPEVTVRANMDSGVLVSGNMDALYAEADRVVSLLEGRASGCVGTGALAYEAEVEVVKKVGDYVRSK